MAEKLKIQGVNATLTVDDEHVCLERKKGPSILDYLGNPITEIAYVDLARLVIELVNERDLTSPTTIKALLCTSLVVNL